MFFPCLMKVEIRPFESFKIHGLPTRSKNCVEREMSSLVILRLENQNKMTIGNKERSQMEESPLKMSIYHRFSPKYLDPQQHD